MAEIFKQNENPRIPYPSLADKLFNSQRQKLIPFLGAGASLSFRRRQNSEPDTSRYAAMAERFARRHSLKPRTARFLQFSARVAAILDGYEPPVAPNVFERVKLDDFSPPSSSEMAAAFVYLSQYDVWESAQARLRDLMSAPQHGQWWDEFEPVLSAFAQLTEVASATPPLQSVSGYYEYSEGPRAVFEKLSEMLANKRIPTMIQQLIAAAARFYLPGGARDYLIITTNYDRLMEDALEAEEVPYCVLTVDKNDRKVDCRWSPRCKAYFGYGDKDDQWNEFVGYHREKHPDKFVFDNHRPIALLYKVHGCVFPESTGRNSIILSDEDYVDFFYRMSDGSGAVPAPLTRLMEDKAFLFLGYSFSDWNIRNIFRKVSELRKIYRNSASDVRDYSVTLKPNLYERRFFDARDIHTLQTTLDEFVHSIGKLVRDPVATPFGK